MRTAKEINNRIKITW